MSAPRQIKLGIPKGSLEEATISLFERAGWKIHKHVRNYFPDINDPDITGPSLPGSGNSRLHTRRRT